MRSRGGAEARRRGGGRGVARDTKSKRSYAVQEVQAGTTGQDRADGGGRPAEEASETAQRREWRPTTGDPRAEETSTQP